jgi:uncharacterized protein (DUF58 family)
VSAVALDYPALATLALAGLLVLAIALGWMLRWPKLDVDRVIHPDRVTAGEPAVGLIRIENNGSRPTPPMLGIDSLAGREIDVGLPRLNGHGNAAFTYRVPTRRRGVYDVGPLRISRSDPLGLAARTRSVSDVTQLWVHPRRHAIQPLPASLDRSLDGPTSDKAPRGSITFHSLREYVLGDDLRHIHWRSSARLGTLMVRQHVDTSLPDVTIVLDTRDSAHTEDSFEEAIEVVASLVVALLRQRFPVRFVSTRGDLLNPLPGGDSETGYLDLLSQIGLDDEGDYVTVANRLSRQRGGFAVIVVSGALGSADVSAIGPLQQSFGFAAVVNMRADAGSVAGSVGRARVVEVPTAKQFADVWNLGLR